MPLCGKDEYVLQWCTAATLKSAQNDLNKVLLARLVTWKAGKLLNKGTYRNTAQTGPMLV